eukprot:101209_1
MAYPQLQPRGLGAVTCVATSMAVSVARVLQQPDPTYLRNLFTLQLHLRNMIGSLSLWSYFAYTAEIFADDNFNAPKYYSFNVIGTDFQTVFDEWEKDSALFKTRAFVGSGHVKDNLHHAMSVKNIIGKWDKQVQTFVVECCDT